MLFSKLDTMKPILHSVSGIHMTAYIRNTGSLSDLKNEIHNALLSAEEHLKPVMSKEEMGRFLAPVLLFQRDGNRLKGFRGSIGLYRTKSSFRALNLPVEVETLCVIADTYHVKPLLKWLQVDREFLLLGLEEGSASLYQGDLHSLKHIDTVIYPAAIAQRKETDRESRWLQTMKWINGWILNLTPASRPRLFVAGKEDLTAPFFRTAQYKNTSPNPISSIFRQERVVEIGSRIRLILRDQARKNFEAALAEFHYAADSNQAKGNIFTIAKAAVQGRIKRLLIADGVQIFGKLNRKNGELKLNGRDLDHEDDDVLDDIAQAVLAQGGQVTVAPRDEIPRGRPILAIFEEDQLDKDLSQVHGTERRAL